MVSDEEMSRYPPVRVSVSPAPVAATWLPKQVTTQLSSQLQLLYILGLHVRHPLSSSQQSFSCYY